MKPSRLCVLPLILLVSGCGGGTSTGNPVSTPEDVSVTGAAVSAVGGALSSTGSTGTQAFQLPRGKATTLFASLGNALDFLPEALASVACSTFKTAEGLGCSASGSTMWLSYADCSFGNSSSVWNGTLALIMSTGSAHCGKFPAPGASASLIRQFVAGANSTSPGMVTVTSASGAQVTADDETANLANFNQDTITSIVNGGYGVQVSFGANGLRNSITLAHHMKSTIGTSTSADFSITGSISVAETAGLATRTVNGSVTVYHNLLKIIGTTSFSDVTHSDSCCYPISGTVTTQFTTGSNVVPSAAGAKIVNLKQSETLTLTGCGTGTLKGADGTTSSVTLTHCF